MCVLVRLFCAMRWVSHLSRRFKVLSKLKMVEFGRRASYVSQVNFVVATKDKQ